MKMKSFLIKLFIFLLVFSAAALVFSGVVYVGIIKMRAAVERDRRIFVNTSVLAVTKDWDKKELLKRASIEYLEASSKEKMDELFASYSRLGHLKKYYNAVSPVDEKGDVQPDGVYTAEADFDAGHAMFEVEITYRSHGFQILKFNIKSDALLK
jgi:hypothetical protein